MIIYKCDKCDVTGEIPKGTRRISHPKGWFDIIHGNSLNGRTYHICPDCRKKLDIPDDSREAEAHVGDQLIGLIEEIVTERMEN